MNHHASFRDSSMVPPNQKVPLQVLGGTRRALTSKQGSLVGKSTLAIICKDQRRRSLRIYVNPQRFRTGRMDSLKFSSESGRIRTESYYFFKIVRVSKL